MMPATAKASAIEIRRYLHSHPELSGRERDTAQYIKARLLDIGGFKITEGLGGHGIMAVKRYGHGPVVAFRAELDALPVQEHNELEYRSQRKAVAHACGHDGHMAMLFALIAQLEQHSPHRGTLVLLFQPAEETGKGARAMLNDLKKRNFESVNPSICFAIHNIPGRPLGQVLLRDGHFACASIGIRMDFTGRTAHAAQPEDAINPLPTAGKLMEFGLGLPSLPSLKGFALSTPIALQSGEASFGTSPASGVLLFTLRARRDDDLRLMEEAFEKEARRLCDDAGLKLDVSTHEYFPAVVNSDFSEKVEEACRSSNIAVSTLPEPFRWSEDFGHFAQWCPIYILGMGSGEEQPALHAPDFDFPDELLSIGGELYKNLYNAIQNND